jgi:hypothetical protein
MMATGAASLAGEFEIFKRSQHDNARQGNLKKGKRRGT